jgi:flagellar FliL protein
MSDAKPEPVPPKKSRKLLLVALLGVALAGGGGAGAWYFVSAKAGGADDEEPHAVKKHDAKPLFVTLDPFTVNLQDPRGERFAQIGITLQFEDPALEMKIKDRLPAVRNEILLLISSKEIDDLLSTEGKQKLAQEIRARSARSLGIEVPDPEVAEAKVAEAKPADKPAAEHKDAAGDDEAEAKPKKKPKKARQLPENPIQQVLFSQFIVQ